MEHNSLKIQERKEQGGKVKKETGRKRQEFSDPRKGESKDVEGERERGKKNRTRFIKHTKHKLKGKRKNRKE